MPAEHADLARQLLSAWSARQPSWAAHNPRSVMLEELGPDAWRLLALAQQRGVSLLHDPPVRLGRARVEVQLSRRLSSGADLQARVLVDDEPVDGTLLGRPAHGVVALTAEHLVLAGLDAPLDPAVQQLLHPTQISAADLPRFLARDYPVLRQRSDVRTTGLAIPEVRPPLLRLDVHFAADHATGLAWSYSYAGASVPLSGPVDVLRDATTERALLDRLPEVPGRHVDPLGRVVLAPEVRLTGMGTALFAADVLPVLQERDDVDVHVSGTPLDYGRASEAPLISVGTTDAGDWFDLAVDVSIGDERVPLADLIAALRKEQEQLVLASGTWFDLDRPELHSLRRLLEEARTLQDHPGDGLRVTPLQAGFWEELVSLGVVARQSERWTRTVGGLLSLSELPTPAVPAGLLATLRPYQVDGYHWLSLLWDHRLGGILADDMGLGKTLQTLAMAVRAKESGTLGGDCGPLLVVAPTSVVAAWLREADRFAPDLRTVAITETQARSRRRVVEDGKDADLVVTSYALLRIDEDAYREQTWSGLVLDEAQFVKNHQAKTYQAARRLPAPFKLAITGTPLENSLMDLWSMLSITAPGLFPNPQRFTETYRKPIESGESPEQLASLRRRIKPLMLRRTKEAVASDLPPKIEQVLSVTLNPAHRRAYDTRLARERQRVLGLLDDLDGNRIAILAALTVLRQLSLAASLVDPTLAGVRSSKLDALVEHLGEVVAEGHRALVFSQFTGFLALVRERLDAAGIEHVYLDGRTRDRPRRIAKFTDGDAPVFCISLKAGGVGLTLTEADYVYVLDPWWNPAAEAQAVDRAHRIGQTKTVNVYRLVAAGTIEEKVVALQERKRDLFARVVGDEGTVPSAMTAEDIRGLFA